MKSKYLIAIVLAFFVAFGLFVSRQSSKPVTIPGTTTKPISLSDIVQHASNSSCWMAIDGKVYDVTDAIGSHPGGEAILQGCGKDATDLFNGVGKHRAQAKAMLSNYQIGILN